MFSLFDSFHCTLSLSSIPSPLFSDACVHVIESEPGAGSHPGVQQPNNLSAQYPARPAGKKLCVHMCVHVSMIGENLFQPSHNQHFSACADAFGMPS